MPVDEAWLKQTAAKFNPDLARTITRERECAKCGYDLTGLDLRGRCPECGTPIAVASVTGVEGLGLADLRLAGGSCRLLAIGSAMLMLPRPLMGMLPAAWLASSPSAVTILAGANAVLMFVGAIVWWAGVAMLALASGHSAQSAAPSHLVMSEWSRLWALVGNIAWPAWASVLAVTSLVQITNPQLHDALAILTAALQAVAAISAWPVCGVLRRFARAGAMDAAEFAMRFAQYGLPAVGLLLAAVQGLALVGGAGQKFGLLAAVLLAALLPLAVLALVGFFVLWRTAATLLAARAAVIPVRGLGGPATRPSDPSASPAQPRRA